MPEDPARLSEAPPSAGGGSAASSGERPAEPDVIRPAEIADYDGIARCLDRNGMVCAPRERWLATWDAYPHAEDFPGVPRGFVIESDGGIVGTITSVWANYCLGGRELRAILAGNAAVDVAHRGSSMRLFVTHLLRSGVDLYLNGSAAAATSKVMDALRVPRVPQADNDVVLLWPARGNKLASAGLQRRGVPAARLLAWPVGLGLGIVSRARLRRLGAARLPTTRIRAFTEEFDDLWRRLRSGSTRLLGYRDAATLEWRYGSRVRDKTATVIGVHRDGVLSGYAILVRAARPRLGLTNAAIQDLQCVDEDPDLLASLMTAALRAARTDGLDALEFPGFAGPKREAAERASLLRHHLDVWQAYYFCNDQKLGDELNASRLWDFSAYDSD
jgi:hypothetical protein